MGDFSRYLHYTGNNKTKTLPPLIKYLITCCSKIEFLPLVCCATARRLPGVGSLGYVAQGKVESFQKSFQNGRRNSRDEIFLF